MSCPDTAALQAHVEGYASDDEREALLDHLEGCRSCRALVLALAVDAEASTVTAGGRGEAGISLLPEAGERVGRYVVLRKLGEGGMGVVYAAYDPELARQVALKLIRHKTDAPDTREVQERLLREGQALARVAHPNVVTVYDVGRHGDQVFVAMELLEGETLALWLARSERPIAEVLAHFLEAARGLQAAHAVGLVHRDFKPNNAMIDRQGRARVMDFGLARPVGGLPELWSGPTTPSRLDQQLTASNVLLGTPAYMAPEQLARGPADARTDQFSFCVALYEALCGTRPFVAADTGELRAAIVESRLQPPRRKVPRWLLGVVTRGLRANPEQRWPSMEVLIQALSRDRTRRLWRSAGALVLLWALVMVGLAYRHSARASRLLCAGSERKLAGVWDGARREAVRRAFDATFLPYAAASFATVTQLADRYAQSWVEARGEACQATRVRGEQSEELLDLRMICLDDRLGQLGATVDLLAHADRSIVEHSVRAAGALPPLDGCSDRKALRERVPPPNDPARRAQIEALERRLHQLVARSDAGLYHAALDEAEPLVAEAEKAGYAPLLAKARRRHGQVLQALHRDGDAAEALERAALEAESGRDDREAGVAWVQLAFVTGVDQSRADEGLRLVELARAKAERAGMTDLDAERVEYTRAAIASVVGRYEEAEAAARRALELSTKIDPNGAGTIASLLSLADLKSIEHRPEEALPLLLRASALSERALGTEHPHSYLALVSQAAPLIELKRGAEALALLDRALPLAQKIHIADNELGLLYAQRGDALGLLGRHDEAVAELSRAVALIEPTHDEDYLVAALTALGVAQVTAGHPLPARPVLERALAIFERSGRHPLERASAEMALARALYPNDAARPSERQRARALATQADQAWAEYEKRTGGHFAEERKDAAEWLAKHAL
jgi:eukaryotic-like serine/threonine-protein kinase